MDSRGREPPRQRAGLMLELSGVSKSFGGFYALQGVSVSVAQGQCHAVIGPNGAGKTTLFNVITGHLKPSDGKVILSGEDVTGMSPHRIVGRGVARSFQRINIFPKLTVYQNVQVSHIARQGRQFRLFQPGGSLYRAETMETLGDVGLTEDASTVAGTLAYGKQKQLELAIALASEPRLLLLDEPTAGMSPLETTESIELVGRIQAARNLTLLFTEHDMNVVFGVADRVTVLHHGEVIATGSPQEVRTDEDVIRVYLGGAEHATA